MLVIHLFSNFLPSIPGLMWSFNKILFKRDPEGVPLNELLLSCPSVKRQKSRVFVLSPSYGEYTARVCGVRTVRENQGKSKVLRNVWGSLGTFFYNLEKSMFS